MRSPDLAAIFRRVLLATLAAGSASAFAGCATQIYPMDDGGRSDAPPSDAAVDAGPETDAQNPVDTGPIDDGATNCTPIVSAGQAFDETVTYPCQVPAGIVPGQAIPSSTCMSACPMNGASSSFSCYAATNADNQVVLNCTYCAVGRRSEGLTEPDAHIDGQIVGTFLANSATLEAASITAFERLYDELNAHGAPADLLASIKRAADEERDHAERVSSAARRHGAEPAAPRFDAPAARTLFEIARENAVEGCVRETLGALVAAWQARNANDRDLASMYARLAVDEADHARLSWSIDAWVLPRLSPGERDAIEYARRAAVNALVQGSAIEPDAELVDTVGLPDAATTRALLRGLERELWALPA